MVFVWDFDNVGSLCSEPEEWLFLLELGNDNWRLLEDGILVDSIPGISWKQRYETPCAKQ